MPFVKIAAAILAMACAVTPAQARDGSELEATGASTPAALVPPSYRLWTGRAPGALGDGEGDVPTLTVYRPFGNSANGTAVVIAPGGAYINLASTLEGSEPAEWFASQGVTAFVLTYRVGAAARLPAVLHDGARAVQFVRYHAKQFGIAPDRVGMMGFSAGGHLAASTAVGILRAEATPGDAIDRISSRPDFLILGYPWLKGTEVTPAGTSQYCDFAAYLKIACNPSDYERYMPANFVTAEASPTFIYHTTNDELVPVSGSVEFYSALHEAGVAVELHAFERGRHGTGLGGDDPSLARWPDALANWLRARRLIGSGPRPSEEE